MVYAILVRKIRTYCLKVNIIEFPDYISFSGSDRKNHKILDLEFSSRYYANSRSLRQIDMYR